MATDLAVVELPSLVVPPWIGTNLGDIDSQITETSGHLHGVQLTLHC